MDAAEEEIKRAQRRHPDKSQEIWDSFRLLVPTAPLSNKADALYWEHCAEILERVANDGDTRPATRAEILGFLVDLSLSHHLGPVSVYWHGTLFTELMAGYYAEDQRRHPANRETSDAPDLLKTTEEAIKAAAWQVSREDLDAAFSRWQRALTVPERKAGDPKRAPTLAMPEEEYNGIQAEQLELMTN